MKRLNIKSKSALTSALAGIMLAVAGASANAALVLSIDTYTTDEVSLSISGTFDEDTIGIFPGYLAVKNDWSNNYGVHTEWFSSLPTITANTILIGGLAPDTAAQNSDIRGWNDNVFFRFADNTAPITAGTTVSGSITLSKVGAFDLADMATLQLVSGLNFTVPISDDDDWARLEANVSAVPLPAAAWLFGSALLGLAGVSRRRK
ncbi:VPLPA-CTERM sorting domain-containing protein [Candidatus Litorirhabdus singularis]|uniref:VPLPA-CTERM sorting domain-containing protein n=1 Tax=Candidatus Litorirhabdus singularis TaxID=2518993 RepID=UPI002431DB83|nr:VPLPA-CTERM sorting domain-containing protein [Candidatus Litorirhabdus singularis]